MSRRVARSAPAFLFAALCFASALATALPSGCARDVPCQLNSDCGIGYCHEGTCRENCVDAARDCPAGYICNINAQCTPGDTSSSSSGGGAGGAPSTSSSGGAATSSVSSSSSGGGTTTSSTVSTSSSSSSTSGGTGKHELELCFAEGECAAPLLCRPMFPGGSKRCTRACSSTGQCMTGTVCEAVGSEMYCTGNDTGRACAMANACNFACLNNQYCTVKCGSGADCPNGYGCMDINGISACVKAAVPCATGDAAGCIAPAACDESPDLYVGGCTLVCNSPADCPQRAQGLAAWTCDGLCRRPPDVFGPLQGGYTPAQYVNDCQGKVVNVCNDGQHIDFNAFNIPSPPAATCGATTTSEGIATDSCLDSCRYQGGCAYGFSCVAVGGINNNQQRIGLCLPNGGGEIGASCQHDSQCAFGYCLNSKCSRDCTVDGLCPGAASCVMAGGPPVDGQPFRRCQ